MNDLAVLMLRAGIHVTVWSVVALGVYAWARRRGPRAAARAVVLALAMCTVLTVAAFCPLPHWWTWQSAETVRSDAPASTPGLWRLAVSFTLPGRTMAEPTAETAPGDSSRQATVPSFGRLVDGDRLSSTFWRLFVAAAVLAGVALSFARLAFGLWAIERLRRLSVPLHDEALEGLLHELQREMCCRHGVELRIAAELATPATVGWLRPVIFLPSKRTDWTSSEYRAVFAHELAHVCRRDYLAGVLARLAVALHFYHPLVRWLASRLTLQQELAADLWGAEFAGGKGRYVRALAQLALRQDERPAFWLARAFLPAPGTLTRRIGMLRNKDAAWETPWSKRVSVGMLTPLVALGLGISALRGAAPGANNAAKDKPATPTAEATRGELTPFDLRYLPADTTAAYAVRPAALFARSDMKAFADLANKIANQALTTEMHFAAGLGLRLEEIDQIVGPAHLGPVQTDEGPRTSLMISTGMVRSVKPFDWQREIQHLVPDVETQTCAGKAYFVIPKNRFGQRASTACFATDERTVVLGPVAEIRGLIEHGPTGTLATTLGEDWQAAAHSLMAVAVLNHDHEWLNHREATETPEAADAVALVQQTKSLVVSVDAAPHVALQMLFRGNNAATGSASADRLLHSAIALGLRDLDDHEQAATPTTRFRRTLLQNGQIEMKGDLMRWHLDTNETLPVVAGNLFADLLGR